MDTEDNYFEYECIWYNYGECTYDCTCEHLPLGEEKCLVNGTIKEYY